MSQRRRQCGRKYDDAAESPGYAYLDPRRNYHLYKLRPPTSTTAASPISKSETPMHRTNSVCHVARSQLPRVAPSTPTSPLRGDDAVYRRAVSTAEYRRLQDGRLKGQATPPPPRRPISAVSQLDERAHRAPNHPTGAGQRSAERNRPHHSSGMVDSRRLTFAWQASAGSVFERMRQHLLRRDAWMETVLREPEPVQPMSKVSKQQQRASGTRKAIPYAQRPVAGVSAKAAPQRTPCCSQLDSITLLLGDKRTTEGLLEEAHQHAMRLRRSSVAVSRASSAHACRHRGKNDVKPSTPLKMVNYFEGMKCITLKAKLVRTLAEFYKNEPDKLFRFLPPTYMISPTFRDDRAQLFEAMQNATAALRGSSHSCVLPALGRGESVSARRVHRHTVSKWIAKSSHGKGGDDIALVDGTDNGYTEVLSLIDRQPANHCWVVQRYIERPLLYKGRKFDIRVWVLVTSFPQFTIYAYRDGVMRTSSLAYDPDAASLLTHITNHSLQAASEHYAAHEQGNELFFDTLKAYIGQMCSPARTQQQQQQQHGRLSVSPTKASSASPPPPVNAASARARPRLAPFDERILPQLDHIIKECLLAAAPHLSTDDPYTRDILRFQFMGFDFIIDENLKVWLLEVNGAPGVAEALLDRAVSDMMELVIDQVFDSPGSPTSPSNGFRRIFPMA